MWEMSYNCMGDADHDSDIEQNRPPPTRPPPTKSTIQGPTTMPVGRDCSAEEKMLKRFARDVGRLECWGNQIKTMTVAWASFVLLGAFSNNLETRDFWFSTIVLLENKISFFNMKYEVDEWHGQGISNAGTKVWRPRLIGWRRCMLVLFYLMKCVAAMYFVSKTISVPVRRLVAEGIDANTAIARNKKYTLVLFYWLIVGEVLFLLSADIYYLYSIWVRRLFHRISRGLGFDKDDLIPIQGFFVECYGCSMDDDLDMVTFGIDLLASNLRNKQLVGVRILKTFMKEKPQDFSKTVLKNMGDNITAMQTLVAVLDWEDRDMFGEKYNEDKDNYETCHSATVVLLRLTENDDENALRVGSLPGSMKTIGCLLETDRGGFGEERGSEILASLAKEEESKERIGRNGKLLKLLFKIFFNLRRKNGDVNIAAGKAIEMLTLEGESNCIRILKLNVLKKLVRTAVRDPNLERRIQAAKILRNLCMYTGESSTEMLKGITGAAADIFQMIVNEDIIKGKEILVGIASFICRSQSFPHQSSIMILKEFGVSEDQLASELVSMLMKYREDTIITRPAIEVANWMISGSRKMVKSFVEKDFQNILGDILVIVADKETEDFEIQILVETTLEILKKQTETNVIAVEIS